MGPGEMNMGEKLVGLGFGIAFGFVLGWAQLSDPAVIHRMLRLQGWDVLLLMGAAMATAAIGVRVLRGAAARTLLDRAPVAWNVTPPERKHVVGSILFGLGWSVACTCPGPLAVQLGRGQFAALFTAAGLIGGIALAEWIRRQPAPAAAPGSEVAGL